MLPVEAITLETTRLRAASEPAVGMIQGVAACAHHPSKNNPMRDWHNAPSGFLNLRIAHFVCSQTHEHQNAEQRRPAQEMPIADLRWCSRGDIAKGRIARVRIAQSDRRRNIKEPATYRARKC